MKNTSSKSFNYRDNKISIMIILISLSMIIYSYLAKYPANGYYPNNEIHLESFNLYWYGFEIKYLSYFYYSQLLFLTGVATYLFLEDSQITEKYYEIKNKINNKFNR